MIYLLLIALFITQKTVCGGEVIAQKKTATVKVLIEEQKHVPHKKSPSWNITSNAGFFLYSPHNKNVHRCIPHAALTISPRHTTVLINGKSYPGSELRICPQDGYAAVNGTQFHGSFSVVRTKDRTYLINHVDLEEYVFSVLKTESWPGWPIEVNKAFAISSRSYVIAMIKQMRKSALPYHVKNTNEHQTYRGIHNSRIIRTAVEHTKGVILTYNNEVALTMFDSCCGGVIPAHIEEFDFEKAPYLARTYACTHCKRCKIYTWEKKLHLSRVSQQVSHLFDSSDPVQEVKITRTDNAGLAREIQVKKGKKRHTLTAQQAYTALKDVKSFCYTITKRGDTLLFEGKGYGHHIGICQWGAREMVRDGWHYKRILDFYYPGTKLATLN